MQGGARSIVALVAPAWLAAACATSGAEQRPAAPTRERVELRYELPEYVIASGPPAQAKAAVTAALLPPAYVQSVVPHTYCTQVGALDPGAATYEVARVPAVVVRSDSTQFRLRIGNRMAQDLTLDGVTVSLRVDGAERVLEPVPVKGPGERRVPPGAEETFAFDAPDLRKLRDGSTVVVAVQGLVVAADAAGRARTRGRLEWAYKVSKASRTEQAFSHKEQLSLDPQHAKRLCEWIEVAQPRPATAGK
jgi:hypothetical protein